MIRRLILLLFFLFFVNISNAQKNTKIVEKFIEYYNIKDSLKLSRLVHQEYIGYWGNHIIIKNKEELLKNFSIDKALNSSESIKIIRSAKDSVITINTHSTDYYRALNIKPYISQKVYYLKKGKVIKVIESVPEEYKEHNESIADDSSDFRRWLRSNYCMSPSQLYQNGKEARFLKKIAESYSKKMSKKELDNIIKEYKSYSLKKFIQEPNELKLQEFIFKAINLLKEKKYTEFLDLYVTEDEFIECFKFYGHGSNMAIREYKENVFTPDMDWFKYKSEKRFFDCYMNYTIVDNMYPEITKFSKIISAKKDIKSNEEYYYSHAMYKIRAFGYGFLEGFEVERDKTSELNFGDVIYIPKKGWRLMGKLR